MGRRDGDVSSSVVDHTLYTDGQGARYGALPHYTHWYATMSQPLPNAALNIGTLLPNVYPRYSHPLLN